MSSPNETISFAGDVTIDEVTIVNSKGFAQTITPQVAGIEIYEDIFSPFMTGNIVVKDGVDLIGLFPLVGNEFLKLRVSTPTLPTEDTYAGEFYIYRVSDRFKTAEREVAYTIHFMSKEGLIDLNKKISRTYSGKISDIVGEIISSNEGLETIKRANIEPTNNNTKYTSNFWSPVQNIMYLTNTAVNTNNSPSYTFFETKHGLNFVSIDSLYDLSIKQHFVWDNYSLDSIGGSTQRNIERDYQRILEIYTPEVYNYIDRVQTGMYASRRVNYDLTSKIYSSTNYVAKDKFLDSNHLNDFSIISNSFIGRPNALIVKEHKYYGNFTGYGDVTNARVVQQRLSLMKHAEAFKLQITVPGRTDYTAGQKVNLRMFKPRHINNEVVNIEDEVDQMYSGNYLIGAINHYITREKHECRMELIKDSFTVDLDKL